MNVQPVQRHNVSDTLLEIENLENFKHVGNWNFSQLGYFKYNCLIAGNYLLEWRKGGDFLALEARDVRKRTFSKDASRMG